MGDYPIRHRQGWVGAGEYQSCLSAFRIGICAEQGWLPRADYRDTLQNIRLCWHGQYASARIGARLAGQAFSRKITTARDGD